MTSQTPGTKYEEIAMDLHEIGRHKRDNRRKILDDIVYRWSPRSMTGQVIDQEDLLSLFEAARWAPSAFNNQPWRFYYALRDSDGFQDLSPAALDLPRVDPGRKEQTVVRQRGMSDDRCLEEDI